MDAQTRDSGPTPEAPSLRLSSRGTRETYAYQKLGMLIQDAPGTVSTVYVSLGIEELPLLDDCADVVGVPERPRPRARSRGDAAPDPEDPEAGWHRVPERRHRGKSDAR